MFVLLFTLVPSIATARDDQRLQRCLDYYDEIVEILMSEEVPSDYFYLAVCESGCQLKISKAGARGFFQLMPPTYRKYRPADCTVDDIDGVRCNSIAAARYIKHLQQRFSPMREVIYAYNMGGHNYEKRGTPTSDAKGLNWCVQNKMKEHKSNK